MMGSEQLFWTFNIKNHHRNNVRISVDSEGYQCFAALGRDTGQQETDEVLRPAHRHTQHQPQPTPAIRPDINFTVGFSRWYAISQYLI